MQRKSNVYAKKKKKKNEFRNGFKFFKNSLLLILFKNAMTKRGMK